MTYAQVGVIGAGTMGAGIAFVCARQGHNVLLLDMNEAVLKKAQSYVASILAKDVSKGKITERQKEEIYERISPISDMQKLYGCDMVIEAVSERLELKKSIFSSLANICREDTLLLTNTSSISITEIAGGIKSPERIIGFHFFNPAPVMPLIEVIRGKKSSDENVEKAYQFAENLGKVPVLVNDTPGFIVNRVARPYYNEALRITGDQVASIEQIDTIMKKAGGFKMGPFELQDMIGIDINFATTESVYTNFFHEGRFKPSRIQQRMVQAGSLGRKSGEGFYEYSE
ncbi:3-hydroxyacyl-CoA dehydrogenase family protein [Aneurinibacillus aneurinilyticus]|uniref:Putative 3-hydroxybutyryl-CoA dehydrogenase n=1 Tax=Aneurinibacillus aneurinilyticus ATCC 12856 TaxID=649747 RepID=U1Y7I9_ANEAE|nr:3-hydroxyacyl-CoA dehydrogenase NAD-binding domain-containing protein [Aneurinibacillus aneurinilyticus]ERI08132.1 putative 3-hydroxybutyryl-CoA dehydrogenase [Aneurinibacillus aneurinilyticus ATCC 12856]MED0708368.1 3-hydroxyacyl-CoA dehydrogenase NAD-binding domain-containing protein [Aneurinibacillus aneurinilyticus]MED0725152.1 3-hydroxyacyl-CoA dehydrogenase NAD-binding domain-containing protein [Aneurinibacillus aneurinilyticus]MED0733994.1 3-hydroxyacyl-CoA dehydrogenase NAD-binding d